MKSKAILIWVTAALLFASAAHAVTVRYVSPDGDDSTGLDWAHAYQSIQTAIDNAEGEDPIWVKQGTYSETVLVNQFVAIKGGFKGDETDSSQRDWRKYPTKIDVSSISPAYHAVMFQTNGEIDGFTITGGRATGPEDDSMGGGIYNNGVNATVSNCIVENNQALFGGGMYNNGGYSFIQNVIFRNNSTTGDSHWGGGTVNDGGIPSYTNCIFVNNHADGEGCSGGGMVNINGPQTTVTNCTFTGNTANQVGGGILNENCYFSIYIKNCILWGNDGAITTTEDEIANHSSYYVTVTYSDVRGGVGGTGNINSDPLFAAGSFHGVYLNKNSPCIDAGTSDNAPDTDIEGEGRFDDPYSPNTNIGVTAPIYSFYDMGADEYQGSLFPGTYYVDIVNGDNAYSGAAASPWKTLHYAISQINDGVPGNYALNMEAGTYSVANGEPDSSLEIAQANVTLHGAVVDGSLASIIDGSPPVGSAPLTYWTAGITVSGANVFIDKPNVANFSGAGKSGIVFNAGASGGKIQAHYIHENQTGILIKDTDTKVLAGVISGNTTGVSVVAHGGTANPDIQGNDIITNGIGVAITADQTGATAIPAIQKNEIWYNVTGIDYGNSAGGTTVAPKILNNLFYESNGTGPTYGIHIHNSSTAMVSGEIHHNTMDGRGICQYGIKVDVSSATSQPEIKYNIITRFTTAGIWRASGSPVIGYNNAFSNGTSGADNYSN